MATILDFKKCYWALLVTSQVTCNNQITEHGVENRVTMATCDTVDAKFFQDLVLQYIFVKVAKFGRYYLKIN